MKRRPKLDAGNWPSWEERIDSQLGYAFDHCYRLRETDHDLFRKVGELHGSIGEHARISMREAEEFRRGIRHCWAAILVLTVLCVALTAAVVWLVVA